MKLHSPSGGHSPATGLFAFLPHTSPKAFKEALGDEIERMIAMLDALDGDSDLEPSLGDGSLRADGLSSYSDEGEGEGDDADLEPSGDENEPSLGSLGSCGSTYALAQTWAGGASDDQERDDADDEDGGDTEPNGDELDCDLAGGANNLELDESDREPSLGSFDRMANQENWSRSTSAAGPFLDCEVSVCFGLRNLTPDWSAPLRVDIFKRLF